MAYRMTEISIMTYLTSETPIITYRTTDTYTMTSDYRITDTPIMTYRTTDTAILLPMLHITIFKGLPIHTAYICTHHNFVDKQKSRTVIREAAF